VALIYIQRLARIEAPRFADLAHAWKTYGGPLCIVGEFVVKEQVSETQLQSLPKDLREKVSCPRSTKARGKRRRPHDSLKWLESLYRLEDRRSDQHE